MKKSDQKRLWIFAVVESAFLLLFSLLYWQHRENWLLSLLMFTPAVSVILTRLFTREGTKALYLRVWMRKNLRCYLATWLLTPVVAYIGAVLYFLLFPQNFTLSSQLAQEAGVQGADYLVMLAQTIPLAVLINPLTGLLPCLGEELAWRGYLLPKFSCYGKIPATLITGLLWGLWHAPIVAMGFNYGEGHPVANILAMLVFCSVLGVIQGYLFFHTGSVWGPVVFHAAINGIDLYAPSQLFMNRSSNLFIGPNLIGLVGGAGLILLAAWCLRQLWKMDKTANSFEPVVRNQI